MAENEEATVEIMEKELYVAAMYGNVKFLQGQKDEFLLRKTREKKNLIHIAIRYEQLEFIKASLERFPNNYKLISDKESSNDNTPLHIAAEMGKLKIMRVLYDYSKKVDRGQDEMKPWMLKNSKGNTAVHVALLHCNVKVARFLLEEDLNLAFEFNSSKETPLHLAIKHVHNYAESESIMARMRHHTNEGEGEAAAAALVIKSPPKEKKKRSSKSLIKFLVQNASSVASWVDAKGSTPLHRAATLSRPDNLSIIITRLILKHFPQSAEVCDADGNSILHLLINKIPSYQEAKSLLKIKQIYALRNHQNHLGNTPLHIAAKNLDINMVQVLLESKTKLGINNSDGISSTSLIEQQNVLQLLRKRRMTPPESEAANKPNINFLKQRMAKLGNEFAMSQDSEGRNFLHLLFEIKERSRITKDDFVDFIKQVLGRFPQLICQIDGNGNTPVHILVRNNDNTKIHVHTQTQNSSNRHHQIMNVDDNNNNNNNDDDDNVVALSSLWRSKLLSELLEVCKECVVKNQQEASNNNNRGRHSLGIPWDVQNEDGNTPLHEAIIAKNKELVLKLLEYNSNSAKINNNDREKPLHLLAGSPTNHDDEIEAFVEEDMRSMVEANNEAVFSADKDGLTPIHRAFGADNIPMAAMLCIISPEAAKMRDNEGNSFWHLLVRHPSHYFVHRLLKNEALRDLLSEKDNYGNTLLHLAIQGQRFDIMQDFLDIWGQKLYKGFSLWDLSNRQNNAASETNISSSNNTWLLDLLEAPNKAGETPIDLIAELPYVPTKIEKCILSDSRMMGIRSSWGIPKSQLKNYMNSMNVIAALLATITFTTAFTVPGGLFEDVGTPIMIQSIAFQVFMISDVIAMCLSTMVLICLLWIMATSNKRESVMIQDFAVTLLLASLVATLLTFMTGVYATFFPVKPWIAITTLALCSLPSLLIHRIIVTKLLLPIRNATLNFYTTTILGPATRLRKKIAKRIIDNNKLKARRPSPPNHQSYPLEP